MGSIKKKVQSVMTRFCYRRYQKELEHQKEAYYVHLSKAGSLTEDVSYHKTEVVKYDKCNEFYSLPLVGKPYVVFLSADGVAERGALHFIEQCFEHDPNCDLIYADEDCILVNEEQRKEYEAVEEADTSPKSCFLPWFKADYSPDTLLSYFCFGKMVAIRRARFLDVCWRADNCPELNLYDFVLKAVEKTDGILHLNKVLFHAFVVGDDLEREEENSRHKIRCRGYTEHYSEIKQDAMKRRGIAADILEYDGWYAPCPKAEEQVSVSIIIPSKDHEELLLQCIESIHQFSGAMNYDIIVVDNGSEETVKNSLERLAETEGFTYLYRPMEFNFSAMCNLGAEVAGGDCLLFLNDDIRVVTPDWLTHLTGMAMLENRGAVGAKLLYPDSSLIQHIGISLQFCEPKHTLLKFDDTAVYRHGRNRAVMNVTAVTGACLLIQKSLFHQIGGFDERLAVAYNDVDLCLRLLEAGYYNVIRNDIVCRHYESVTRGADSDPVKRARLEQERNLLFSLHGESLKADRYDCELDDNRLDMGAFFIQNAATEKTAAIRRIVKDNYLSLPDGAAARVDYAGLYRGDDNEKKIRISGWFVVPYTDNCRYTAELLLCGRENAYLVELIRYFRQDIADAFQTEKNVKLAGFVSFMKSNELPSDEYEIYLYLKDRCSRQRLCQKIKDAVLKIG